jgi:capsule biosynthesis phosphatase
MTSSHILDVTSPYEDLSTFLKDVDELIRQYEITDVVYTNCKMLKLVYDNWDDLQGSRLMKASVIPDRESLAACLDKARLYEMFPDMSPKVYDVSFTNASGEFFGKPKYGTSGEGAVRFTTLPGSRSELWDTHVFTDYLPGDEFTVDCVSWPDGTLYDFNVRVRERIREGITAFGSSSAKWRKEVEPLIEQLAKGLKLPGTWFAQFKLDDTGAPKLMEVNCRISGSTCITKAARKDYVAWFWDGYNGKHVQKSTTAVGQRVARHMAVLPIARKSFVFDLDGTICTETRGDYHYARPIQEAIETVNRVYETGNEVIIHTARGMKRHNNDAAAVYAQYFALTQQQLERWGVKYDKLILGKPYGVPVDDDGLKMREVSVMIDELEAKEPRGEK